MWHIAKWYIIEQLTRNRWETSISLQVTWYTSLNIHIEEGTSAILTQSEFINSQRNKFKDYVAEEWHLDFHTLAV